MKLTIRWSINRFSTIGFLLIAGSAAAAPVGESALRISIAFIEPEKFIDAAAPN